MISQASERSTESFTVLYNLHCNFLVRWSTSTGQSDIDATSAATTRATSTRRPSVSTTTPSWWHRETTPFHTPGNFAPYQPSSTSANTNPIVAKPNNPKQQLGDLEFLSISSFPYFDYFVKPISKTFAKKPEYEFLHHYPAELLQDIENEPYELKKANDQDIVNDFRRVYDDFFTRVRVFAPVTGKKRVPPTRPYVLFLIIYDVYKREAKRLALQEFTV